MLLAATLAILTSCVSTETPRAMGDKMAGIDIWYATCSTTHGEWDGTKRNTRQDAELDGTAHDKANHGGIKTATITKQPVTTQPVAMANNANPGAQTCFIATAAYGTPWEPNVVTLRCFRERYLRSNVIGRWLVSVYYDYSPPVADYIHERAWARGFTRVALMPVVILAGASLGQPHDLLVLIASIICCFACIYYRKEIKMFFRCLLPCFGGEPLKRVRALIHGRTTNSLRNTR